jgi:hypothetical protein
MGIEGGPCERIRSALFVDFDNIHSRLKEAYGKGHARSFGCNPDRWVAWIERHATGPCVDGRPFSRKLLVRRCYMNPEVFSGFRPKFTQAAFEVIDCPPLTDQEKTSTDMHLVIDVLDALTGPVHLDEFIILSGDADFTPLLVRLRKHDRSTAIFCVGPASAAYKSASDSIIPVNEFISQALGMSCEIRRDGAPAPGAPAAPPTAQVAPAADSGATPAGTSGSGAQAEAAPVAAPVAQPDPPAGSKAVGPHKAPRPYRRPPDKPGSTRLGNLVSKIHRLTGLPNLSHDQYAALFEELAEEINANGCDPHETCRAVQRRCAAKNVTVMEGDVDTVMEGCHRVDYWFTKGRESAEGIAQGYLKHIKELCRTGNLSLSARDVELLDLWIIGKGTPAPKGDGYENATFSPSS